MCLLSISHSLQFDEIFELAKRHIWRQWERLEEKSGMQLVELIILAERCPILEWLEVLYRKFIKRDDPITEYEAEKLGLRTTVALCRKREEYSSFRRPTRYRLR